MSQKQGIGLHNGRVHDSLRAESTLVTVLAREGVAVQVLNSGLHILLPNMTPDAARRFAELLNAAADDVEAHEKVAA